MKLRDIYIVDGVRTPIGLPFKSLKSYKAAHLGSFVIKEILRRVQIEPGVVSEVVLGNCVHAGTGQNLARQAALLGGLPHDIRSYTIDQACGSGIQAVILAAQSILSGFSSTVIAGGAESATHTPNLLTKDESTPEKDRAPVDSLIYDGLWCLLTGKHMLELCEALAAKNKISRKAQDEFSFEGHRKAAVAAEEGCFSSELFSTPINANRFLERDEHVRRRVTMEGFSGLPPALVKNGTLTAGNSSTPCDGAAALLVSGSPSIRQYQLAPKARISGFATVMQDPLKTFETGTMAIEACLNNSGLKKKDIDLFEISESFAAQVIYTRDKLRLPTEKVNVFGGDIALGHPLGAAGTRSVVTLLHALIRLKKKRGVACICFGGGGAVALAIENLFSDR